MLRSFYQGISAMKAMSEGLSVTGDNIANARTTSYKAKRALFEDLFKQVYRSATVSNEQYSGVNPIEIGNGVRLKGLSIDHSQGTPTYTGRESDLAISGKGYFILGDSNAQNNYYTRDGSFGLNAEGRLTASNGMYVLGWNINPFTGEIDMASGLRPIEINLNEVSEPLPTTNAILEGNLNGTAEIGSAFSIQIPAYDSIGARHDIDFTFIKINNNQYVYVANPSKNFISSPSVEKAVFHPSLNIANQIKKGIYQIQTSQGSTPGTVNISLVDPDGMTILTKTINDSDQVVSLDDGNNQWFTIEYKSGGAPSVAQFQIAEVGTMTFGPDGGLLNSTGSGVNGSAQLDFMPVTNALPLSINVDFSNITNLAADNTVKTTFFNGVSSAVLKGYSIGDGGVVTGYFSDGTITPIAQIALASFPNESGLSAQGENMYIQTGASGEPEIGIPGTGDFGSVHSGYLEGSNVDLASELTELMFYQNAYSANSKTITISNQILEQAINLIR